MDNEKLLNDYTDPEATPGVICKAANVSPLECTEDDLKKINKYTLRPKTAEEVFAFKMTIADNEQDDRNSMPFNLKALQDLKKLYPGKPMIKDHRRTADGQVARVFDTELVQNANKTTELGELYTELEAKAYMIRTESNKDLIAEIEGGLKKEVSTSTVPEKMICNICGADNMKDYCRHWPGMEYEVTDSSTGKSSKRKCKMLLAGAKEAYELSFVVVGAQPRAGTHKSIGFTKPVGESVDNGDNTQGENETKIKEMDERILAARLNNAASFFNAKN